MTSQDRSYLALDTSGNSFRVCALHGSETFVRHSMDGSERASLPELVSGALEDANLDFSALAGIAVSSGPGSFTGLRVGLSFAKAIALSRNIPLLGISSFEQALDSEIVKRCGTIELMLIHMKAESYYVYAPGGPFDQKGIKVADIAEISQEMTKRGSGGQPPSAFCFIDSPAPEAFLTDRGNADRTVMVPLEITDLARLACQRFDRNEVVDWRRIEPLYVQRSNAEINFDAHQGKQTDAG